MKKVTLLISILSFLLSGYADNYRFDYSMCAFFDADGSEMGSNGSYALVAYTADVDIADYTLLVGDSFVASSWLNGRSDTGIYVLSVGNIFESQVVGHVVIDNTTLPYGLYGNENLAVMAWQQYDERSDPIIQSGTTYVVYSPTMTGGESGCTSDPWALVVANQGNWQLNLLTASDDGTLDDSYTTLSNVVVPEPSAMSVIFGVFALLAILVSRRYK